MTTSEQVTPTNADIALMLGWRHGELSGWYFEDGTDEPPHHDDDDPPADYLGSTGTLDEGIAFLKEKGWGFTIEFAAHESKPFDVFIDYGDAVPVLVASSETISAAFYTALWRAATAEKEG